MYTGRCRIFGGRIGEGEIWRGAEGGVFFGGGVR